MSILRTDRLTIRPYSQSDRDEFVALNTDDEVRRHVNGALALHAAIAFFDRLLSEASSPGNERWAVVLREEETYLGHAFLTTEETQEFRELGFLFLQRYWGRGFATEVARSVIGYVHDELRFERLIATVDIDHVSSIRVLEKAGMQRDAEKSDEHGSYFVYSIGRKR